MKKITNADLSKYSGFGCGGGADVLFEIEVRNELIEIIKLLNRENRQWYLIGRGFNTLISDSGVRGAVLLLRGEFCKVYTKDRNIIAGSGASLSEILKTARDKGLGGLEFLAGIPGSAGGAVYKNAGTAQKCMADIIAEIEVYDALSGSFKRLKSKDIGFGYRKSNLSTNSIITEVVFYLKIENKTDIIAKINRNLQSKKSRQPILDQSCGCVFKNFEFDKISAAEYIQKAGLAGCEIGDAKVSPLHVNFITNKDNATSKDIWLLINRIKKTVKQKYGKELELEIDLLGEGFE
jgi:UDP-N-acetylmuramate dehydrogenase